jgi:predicted phage terminase large subunit-like protein
MNNLPLSQADAARLLLERRQTRRDFLRWCEYALEPREMKPAAHHKLLIRELAAVAAGENDRLMVFMPPGSAKSTYTSDLFPPWFLAQTKDRSIIAASNTADLAQSFSRRVRGRVREYGRLLGYGLDREAEELWTTTNGGQYRAAGVGGVITGLRADLAVIDDPIRSREDADSETRRNRVWEWFQDDLTTRLRPGAGIVLVQTRWHEDDLAGRLLEREAKRWRVLKLPAIAEDPDDPLERAPGAALWGDDEYGYGADLIRKRETADARTWAALYQQRPAPAEGSLFQRRWIIREEPPPRENMRVYGASDYAVTADGGDFTVHVVAGMDPAGRLHLLDVWRAQASADVWIEAFCDLALKWKPLAWAEETGQIRAGVGPFLERRMRERKAYVYRRQFPTRGDKAVRAQSIIGRMALDGLRVAPDAPWIADLEAELLAFPAGKHDDQVDGLGLIGQLLDVMSAGRVEKPPEQPRFAIQAAPGGIQINLGELARQHLQRRAAMRGEYE